MTLERDAHMLKNTVSERAYDSKEFNQQVCTNHLNLKQRVKAIHQERIKVLQKELVEISCQNGHQKKIAPLLEEIKKVRSLLSFDAKKTQSC